jgi:PAS domain S-box-containing protein
MPKQQKRQPGPDPLANITKGNRGNDDRSKEARMHAIVEAALDCIVTMDHEGRIVAFNPAAERTFGYSREEAVGQEMASLIIPPSLRDQHRAGLARYLSTGQAAILNQRLEITAIRKSGEEFPVELAITQLPSDGGPPLFTGFVRDITERKRTEAALRQSQAELEDFFENSTVGLHWVDADGIILRANRTEMELLGYSAEEYIGQPIARFHVDADVIEDILYRLSAGQELHSYEARLRCKDGSIRHVLISSNVLFEEGKFIHTRCFTRDITERRIAEAERARATEEARLAEERRASAEALRQSEERFRLLVEQVKDYAIFMLDPQGNIATWNEGAERFKGYTASEIIGQHFSRFYTPEDIARRHPWNELEIATREGRYEEEGWRLRKDGSRFWANVVITALRDEQGELRGFGKVTCDMTERRAREREQAEAQLAEQQRRLLKEMLASVTGGRLTLCDSKRELPEHLMLVTEPDEPSTIDLDKPMLRWLRHRALDAARQAGMDKERMGKLVTAVNEAAMNAIVHAGGGTATVEVDPQSGAVQVWVEDQGPGFDMSRLPKATLDRGFTTAGTLGHGFKLVLATADRVWLLTGPTGTTVVLQQGREEPVPRWLGRPDGTDDGGAEFQ